MLKNYFKTLDMEGVASSTAGCVVFILACIVARWLGSIYIGLGGLVLLVGVDYTGKLFNMAMLGSIYRQKEGKNKLLYLSKKSYLDARFKDVFGTI